MENRELNLERYDDLVRYSANLLNTTLVDTKAWYDALFSVIQTAICEGKNVKLQGIGTFIVSEQEETQKRNPLNGEPITVPAHKRVRFRITNSLKAKAK